MNKRITLFFIAMVLLSVSLSAQQNKMSAYTRFMLNTYNQAKTADVVSLKNSRMLVGINNAEGSVETAKAIIKLQDGANAPADKLAEIGVYVNCAVGDYITATLPVDTFEKVAELDEVESVSLAKPVNLLNDAARLASKINDVHAGIGLTQGYKGEGVIVGVVDSGVDFNHINFKDENGNTRIKLAGCYDPSQEAYNIYYDPVKITGLTTDTSEGSHGTHVTGIAAGSYTKNGYYGMAPASDLALFGLQNNLYDADIINGIYWIFYQADNEKKPAVVNVSLGSTMGPHDGTSYFNQIVDGMCGEGKVVVVAAGNNGHEKVHINKTFDSSTTPVSTTISCSGSVYSSMVDIWSNKADGTTPLKLQFFIYDRKEGKEVYKSNINDTIFTRGEYREYIWNDAQLANYFQGTIGTYSEINQYNNKQNVFVIVNGGMANNNYRVGIRMYGEAGTEMNGWAYPSPTAFADLGKVDFVAGTTDNSYNDMACGKNVISVGAYTTKTQFTGIGNDGVEGDSTTSFYYPGAVVGDIGYFSSYGVDLTGRAHPDITAPGYSLVSSVNGYDTATTVTNKATLIDEVSITGDTRKYHWGDMAGTSMAAPVVTGAVALMLQANPSLTPQNIRNILQSTAVNDSYTATNAEKWGAGKMNAKAALIKALQSTSIKDIFVRNDEVMLYPNPSKGVFSVYTGSGDTSLNVNIYSMSGSLVYSRTLIPDNGIVNVDASSELVPGIYVVKVDGETISNSSRLVVK